MQEQRRFLRIPESLPISYEVLLNKKAEGFLTRDISQGGIRFFIHEFIPKHSLLKIRLDLQRIAYSFDALVRVVWIKKTSKSDRYEVGVEFISILQEAAKRLMNYIENYSK